MVRTYVRKTQRGPCRESLFLAMEAVRTKSCSQNQAATNFGVAEATLRRYLKRGSEHELPVGLGRYQPVFNADMEDALATYILELGSRYFGFTGLQLRQFAYEYAVKNNVQHCFNVDSKAAGDDWLAGFLRRHKEISLRIPESMSMGRLMGFNKPQVNMFFELLKDLMAKHTLPPSRIYNADESGVPTVPTRLPKVLAPKGLKRVAKVTSAERGRTVTIVCCMNAVGNYIPPAFIFPRVNMRHDFMDDAPVESLGLAHKSGWMNQELFVLFLKHFVKHARPTQTDPVLLIVDNHSSHMSMQAIDYCRDNHVIMLSLPPHGTHMLQPLDVAFFGPFKTYYSQACDSWMINHPGRVITEAQIGGLVRVAYEKAATQTNARKGFEQTGICPFNQNKFSDTDFSASLLSERPMVETVTTETAREIVSTAESTNSIPVTSQHILGNVATGSSSVQSEPVSSPTSSTSVITCSQPQPPMELDGSSTAATTEVASSAITGTACPETVELLLDESASSVIIINVESHFKTPLRTSSTTRRESALADTAPDSMASLPSPCQQSAAATPASSSSVVMTPEAIRPYPVAARAFYGSGKKRKAGHATIITSSPFKAEQQLILEAKNKKSRPKPKSKCVARNILTSQNEKKKTVSTKTTKSKVIASECCMSCGYSRGDKDDPLNDDMWVVCSRCKNRCHESCGTKKRNKFICNNCSD